MLEIPFKNADSLVEILPIGLRVGIPRTYPPLFVTVEETLELVDLGAMEALKRPVERERTLLDGERRLPAFTRLRDVASR